MTGTAKLYCGLATLTLMAGCQQPTSYSASDIAPSSFVLDLIDASDSNSAESTAAESPVRTETVAYSPEYTSIEVAEPVDGGAYVFEDTVSPVTYTEQAALTVEPIQAAPVYLEASDPVQVEVEVQVPPADLYVEPAYVAAPPVQSYVEQQPVQSYVEQQPVLSYVEPVFAAAPAEAIYVEQPTPVAEVNEVAPEYVEEVANLVDEAPLDLPFKFASSSLPGGADSDLEVLNAPVLPSTEIIESELAPLAPLAPLVKEVAIPTRSGFTPIPQPGLAGYGEAF